MTRASQALDRLREALEQSADSLPAHAPLFAQLRSARDWGRTACEVAADVPPPLPTTVPAVDELLAGGLPRGQLVELIGGRSSGRFSTVLATVAAATTAGESAALIDLGDSLDPQAAVTLGVDLQRLLWLRPITLKQALASAEILIGGGFSLVALDLGSPPVPGGRGLEAAWLRLARAAQANHTALLIASPYRATGTAAAAVLQGGRSRILWENGRQGAGAPLLSGVAAAVTLEKRRNQALTAAHPAKPLTLWLPEAAALLAPLPLAERAAPAAAHLPAAAVAVAEAAAATDQAVRSAAGTRTARTPIPMTPAGERPTLRPAHARGRGRRRSPGMIAPPAATVFPAAHPATDGSADFTSPRVAAAGYRQARRG